MNIPLQEGDDLTRVDGLCARSRFKQRIVDPDTGELILKRSDLPVFFQ